MNTEIKNAAIHPIVRTWSLKAPAEYAYLWMMYVSDVNLDEHCLKCLKGKKSKHFSKSAKDGHTDPVPIVLDEADVPFYYICGGSKPDRWVNNLHIAFVCKPGSVIEVDTPREHWVIENAERIDILEDFIDKNDPHIGDTQYRTCRNWQFAHYVKKVLAGQK